MPPARKKASVGTKAQPQDNDRLLIGSLFASETGKRALAALVKRFGLTSRVYIGNESQNVCPIKAAIRDGERAAVGYLIDCAKHALTTEHNPKPTITIEL